MEIRYHIMQFSTEMEENLRKHDKDKGRCGWVDMDPKVLLEKLMGEILELSDALIEYPNINHKEIIDECADVANYAMMIANIARRRRNDE